MNRPVPARVDDRRRRVGARRGPKGAQPRALRRGRGARQRRIPRRAATSVPCCGAPRCALVMGGVGSASLARRGRPTTSTCSCTPRTPTGCSTCCVHDFRGADRPDVALQGVAAWRARGRDLPLHRRHLPRRGDARGPRPAFKERRCSPSRRRTSSSSRRCDQRGVTAPLVQRARRHRPLRPRLDLPRGARRFGPRRLLQPLLYAESTDLAVPAWAIDRIFDVVHPPAADAGDASGGARHEVGGLRA